MDSPGLADSLLALAQNHQWTWSETTTALFGQLPSYEDDRHPIAAVEALDESAWNRLDATEGFVDAVAAERTRVRTLASQIPVAPDVAYFSPEFGITEVVPQYSGGLGILAGDHLKAASDLGVSLCGVGLFYRGGFFRQSIADRRQAERYERYEPAELGCIDTGIDVSVPFPGRDVAAHVWRLDVGRVALILLDTDVPTNTTADRAITDRLYSGDRRHRIEQELILGVGGTRALHALGWDTPVKHLNEGHAGFLILELLDQQINAGASLSNALAAIRPGLVFTTHTPVPAGIDRFEPTLATEYLSPWAKRWNLPVAELLTLGHDPGDKPKAFNMAALCLQAANRTNGVSKLHGEVSRQLFAGVPGGNDIGSVTNGVHARTWVTPPLQHLFDATLGEGWDNGGTEAWDRVDNIDASDIIDVRRSGGARLAKLVSDTTGETLDPDALIIGFARRFATYKRANLLLRHPDALAALFDDDARPIHFVFAGKAHPADDEGKAVLADIVGHDQFVFIPDYDIAVAKAMYAGCDVWLNNPVRPHEASGTSGEKSALNGGLNCSISDGWWDEMADDNNGWTIPSSSATTDAVRDDDEARAALAILGDKIVPTYYADDAPWSASWIDHIRHNWRTLGPKVTAARMVSDYCSDVYEPALADLGSS